MHHGDPHFLMESHPWGRGIQGTPPALQGCVHPSKHMLLSQAKQTLRNSLQSPDPWKLPGSKGLCSWRGRPRSQLQCLLPSQRLPALSLPTLTQYESTGLWESAWETWCASFPGSSAGLLLLLAGIQQAEPSLEQGFQPSPHTCAVRRAETSVVGSCFRSHLCVEASWLGTAGFAKKPFFFFFIFNFFFPLVDPLTRPRGTLRATSLLRVEQILLPFMQGED